MMPVVKMNHQEPNAINAAIIVAWILVEMRSGAGRRVMGIVGRIIRKMAANVKSI